MPPLGEHLLLTATPFLHELVVGKAPMLVGCADEQVATWPQHTQSLGHGSLVVGDMFENVEHRDCIERSRCELKACRVTADEANSVLAVAGSVGEGRFHVQVRNARGGVQKARQPAPPTSDLKDFSEGKARSNSVNGTHLLTIEEPEG